MADSGPWWEGCGVTPQNDPDTDLDADLAALGELSDRLSEAIRSIAPEQSTLPTPCDGWDLAALVDHVTGGNWFSCRILTGETAEQAMAWTMEQFGDGSAETEQAATAVGDQLVAFNRHGVLDMTWSHIVGELTGRQILRLRLHDLIVHCWDIEQTLRPPASVAEDLAAWGIEELAAKDSLTSTHFDLTSTSPGLGDRPTAYLAVFGRSAGLS